MLTQNTFIDQTETGMIRYGMKGANVIEGRNGGLHTEKVP